jgi:hypothetical protein
LHKDNLKPRIKPASANGDVKTKASSKRGMQKETEA